MGVQINLGSFKIATIDKSFVNIGPSLQTVLRGRQHQNQGFGELTGDNNALEEMSQVIDNDMFDVPWKKDVRTIPRGPR